MRLASILCASASLAFALGCASRFEVRFDENEDFGRYRTWSWLPDAARTIDAPIPYRIGLDRELTRLVDDHLRERGLEHVERGGDLAVGAVLNVRREVVSVLETRAVQQLSSYTSDGAYEIQGSYARKETWERVRLVVHAMDPADRRRVWIGVVEDRFEGQFPPHVGELVAELLERFPDAGRLPGGGGNGPNAVATSTPL